MDSDRLEKWVEEKLDKGVDPERLKKSLEETGNDPEIVDRIQDPFDDGEKDVDLEETDADSLDEALEEGDDGEKGEEKEDQEEKEEPEAEEGEESSVNDTEASLEDDSGGRSLPHISINPDPSSKSIIGIVLILLLGAGTASAMLFMPDTFDSVTGQITDGIDRASEGIDPAPGNSCPDVGLLITSVSSTDSSTTADIRVTKNSAEVVMEVYSGGERVGSSTKSFGGDSSMTVEAVGDRVVVHPVDCQRVMISRDY